MWYIGIPKARCGETSAGISTGVFIRGRYGAVRATAGVRSYRCREGDRAGGAFSRGIIGTVV